ncbi:unnamed protein product [Bathycoccus prasinos]
MMTSTRLQRPPEREEEEKEERFFAVTYTNETHKKRPKWKDGFVRIVRCCAASHSGSLSVVLYGANAQNNRSFEEVTRESFASSSETTRKKAGLETIAKISRKETKAIQSVLEKLEEENTIEEFSGYKVEIDEEFGKDGNAVSRQKAMNRSADVGRETSLFRATRSIRESQTPASFRNPMFTKTTTVTIDTLTPIQTVGVSAKDVAGKRSRIEEEEMNDVGLRDVGAAASKENEQPCNAAKQPKRVNIAAALKERLANLTKQKEEKEKMMEIVAVEEEEEEKHTEGEEAMVPQRVVNYGNTNSSYAQQQQQQQQHNGNSKNNQYRYAEPTIAIKFPFEKLSAHVALRFEGGVREYQNYLLSTSCEQLSLKLRNVSDAVRTVVHALPQQKRGAPVATTSVHVNTTVDPKNLGIRLGRQYRIHYWSECKMTAYKTQTKKDEETGTVKLSKTVVELTLGRCEYHRPNDFAKGDVYVLSTDPGFFLSSPVAKNTRQGMDTYKNWTGVVASTWHAPDKEGKMHVEMLGDLPRTLKESLKNSSNGGWVKRKSLTLYAARALSAFGELEEMKNALEMVKEDTMPLMRMIMNPSVAELTSEHAENITADEEEDFQDLEFTFQNQYGLNHDQAVAMKGMVNTECGVSLVHGPFGSGKTKLVASFIREHVASVKDMQHKLGVLPPDTKQRNGRILVCANTNVAVDRVLKTLLENGFTDFCRVGSLTKIDADILPFSIHAKRDSKKGNTHIEELEKALKENEKISSRRKRIEEEIKNLKIKGALQKRAKLVKSAPVVAVTCSSCVNKHLEDQKFDILILDECSQMTEICSLLPLARFGVKHLIAVGDPKQLPPVLESNLEYPTISEQQPTLFVRLAKLGLPVTLLRTQYRMHPLLSEVPNAHFYENKLLDGVSASDRGALLEGVPPLVFFDTHGENAREERGGQSKFNASEARGCAVIARELLNRGLKPKDVGIIAFYRAQVDCVNSYLVRMRVGATTTADILAPSELDEEEDGEIQVSTVDAFQGQEKKVIILTLCGAFKGSNSFTTRERLNVALTRSQRHEFIVADSNEIGRDCLALRDVLSKARKTPSGYHPASRRIDDVVCKWPSLVTATSCDFDVATDIERNAELKEDDADGESEDIVCVHDDADNANNDIASPSSYTEYDDDEDEEEDNSDEPSPPASPKVEEKVEFDMNEAERKNEYDPSSCPQEYLPIIEKLEEIEIQPDEYYLWYKKLSRALLFRVQADRRWCELDNKMRTMLHDLGFPGIDHVSWKWTSKPLRRAIFEKFFPAFAYYVHKHFGYEYTRMRKLIEKYDSVDALRKDETGFGLHAIREAETQDLSERGARWLTRKLSSSE